MRSAKNFGMLPARNCWTTQSATKLVKAIKEKKISALELLEAYIERVEHLNPSLNAIVATDYTPRKRAKEANKAREKGEDWGVLHGLPMTITDNLEVVGMPCTAGAPALKEHMPKKNADLVQRLVDLQEGRQPQLPPD
jgi:amidase